MPSAGRDPGSQELYLSRPRDRAAFPELFVAEADKIFPQLPFWQVFQYISNILIKVAKWSKSNRYL